VIVLIGASLQVPFKILVVGIPNVGKSSLINAWRRIYLNRGALGSRIHWLR
jgi:ribosome biogenesis GTPase A